MSEQDDVLAFLERGGLGSIPERIVTHGAVVLLTASRAYKLKRAVRYSFMDFSTLERRRAALSAELRLNRRTAPDVYRRLVPVTRTSDGALTVGGAGPPVEWLLEMERFPAGSELDRIAERGELSISTAERLGETIAAFHAGAAIRQDRGGSSAMHAVIDGNGRDLDALAPTVFDVAAVKSYTEEARHAAANVIHVLNERRTSGSVRHCHGDLHLGNIIIYDDKPVLFDCLEFDSDLACIDVIYDFAFLLMDLISRNLEEHARVCLQAWVDARMEDDGLRLLPLFLSVRAAIRAKVEGLAALAGDADPGTAERRRAAARRYLELARRALQTAPTRLVAIGGRSGTGKSVLAARMAPQLGALPGALVLRSDVVRKRLHGRLPGERLPQPAYAADVSAAVMRGMEERAAVLLRAGRSVVCDAVFGQPEQRAAIEQAARAAGIPFLGLWLEADEQVLLDRVAGRRGDPSDADTEVVRRQAGTVVPPTAGWRRVFSGDSADATWARARQLLAHD